MKLPPRVQKAVANVIHAYDAIDARIERGEPRGSGNAAFKELTTLLTEIGLERSDSAEFVTLNPLQRAALTALTAARSVPVEAVISVPPHWGRRRWLGLAPPGLLEKLWGETWPANLDKALAEIPDEQRVEASVELLLSSRRVFDTKRLVTSLPKLARHALAYAKKTLPELSLYEMGLPEIALFTAFSASGESVPEGADEHFPLSYRLEGEPLANRVSTRFLKDHFGAVTEARRDVVLTNALRRAQDGGKYHAAIYLLEHFGPLPNATKAVERYLAKAKGLRMTGHEKKVIADLARRMKALTPVAPKKKAAAARPKAKAKAASRKKA